MLKSLNIANLVIIHRLNFDLHLGLNLLTGETGAGKSIIVDALMLLLGGRGGADLIRTGEKVAVVEGLFEFGGAERAPVGAILRDAGVELEDGEAVLIRREVTAGGRSRIFVNEQSVTAATLKSLQPSLVEILGQGEQHALLGSRSHLELLDGFAGSEGLRREVSQAYARWRSASEELRALRRDESERLRLGEFLRYQIAELERANLKADEEEELAREQAVLAHAERALELCAQSYADLYEKDQSILARLAVVRRRLQDLSAIDARVAAWGELSDAAEALLGEVSEALRSYGGGIDFSAERLGELEGRMAEIEKLKRKYGRDFEGLFGLKEQLKQELEQLSTAAEREEELARRVEEEGASYVSLAGRLSELRLRAAPELEERMSEELRQLALERAHFKVSVETTAPVENQHGTVEMRTPDEGGRHAPAAGCWTPSGADRVEFLLSANVGESPRPLSRVASGGELSRLMLALRTVCRGAGEAGFGATLIFDEVDAGIGGKTAEAVGRRLKSLAAGQQVLCVTHQPQIARFADHHYVVSKGVEGGRTLTRAREVCGEERVGELARMIGGAEDVSSARETARWMLRATAEPQTEQQQRGQSGGRRAPARRAAQRRVR